MNEKQRLALKINLAHARNNGGNWIIKKLNKVSRRFLRKHWEEIKSELTKDQLKFIKNQYKNII